jgi:inner membrane protein
MDVATPIGHALAGYAIYTACGSSREGKQRNLIVLIIIVALLADFDLILGIVMGRPALFHQGITHSLGFALLVSVVIAGLYYGRGMSFPFIVAVCFFAYLSHLVIDFFGPDARLPYGIPLLWPMSDKYFISPVPIFWGVRHAASTNAGTGDWIGGLLDIYNVGAIIVEILLLAPFMILARRYRQGSITAPRSAEGEI